MVGHNIIDQGIYNIVSQCHEFSIVGEANNHRELLRMMGTGFEADLVIIGAEVIERIGLTIFRKIRSFSSIKILVISAGEHKPLFESFKHVLDGFISNDSSVEELVFAIKQVHDGNRYVGSTIVFKVIDKIIHNGSLANYDSPILLSPHEKKILAMVSDGLTNQEIADNLVTSKRSIEFQRKNLILKTGTRNTASLIKFAFLNNMIGNDPV